MGFDFGKCNNISWEEKIVFISHRKRKQKKKKLSITILGKVIDA